MTYVLGFLAGLVSELVSKGDFIQKQFAGRTRETRLEAALHDCF
jgi:hypothetical protein